MLNILIASDHAGFELKSNLIKEFKKKLKFQDLGPFSSESVDYPDYANKLAQKIDSGTFKVGILICGSGIGMSMVANRFKKVRAALCLTNDMARLARQHNDANVLVLGSRLISFEEAITCLNMFLKTKYDGGRHQARLDKFNLLE